VTLESCVYETLAKFGVNLFMLNLNPSSTGFAVPRDQYSLVGDVLDGLVVPMGTQGRVYVVQIGAASKEVETQANLLSSLGEVRRVKAELTEGCTMVSLVGHDYMQQPGVFHRVLTTLFDAEIPVLQTSDSDYSLSVLIPESETNRAVRLLHDRFQLAAVS
jgi:aspartate kinase